MQVLMVQCQLQSRPYISQQQQDETTCTIVTIQFDTLKSLVVFGLHRVFQFKKKI